MEDQTLGSFVALWEDSPYIEEKLFFSYISDRFQALKAALLYPLFTLATGAESKKEAVAPLLETVYILSTIPRFLLGLQTYGAVGLSTALILRGNRQTYNELETQKKKLPILRDVKVAKFDEIIIRFQKWQESILDQILSEVSTHSFSPLSFDRLRFVFRLEAEMFTHGIFLFSDQFESDMQDAVIEFVVALQEYIIKYQYLVIIKQINSGTYEFTLSERPFIGQLVSQINDAYTKKAGGEAKINAYPADEKEWHLLSGFIREFAIQQEIEKEFSSTEDSIKLALNDIADSLESISKTKARVSAFETIQKFTEELSQAD